MPKKKKIDSGPGKAYLLSFSDTMTALCAFFIVLNSLAKEQTGANLHAGTGSFTRSLQSFGVPGIAPGDESARAAPMPETSPLYVVPDDENSPPEPNGTGPDENADQLRVIDREVEDFERFLNEMGRFASVTPEAQNQGEITFDVFNRISEQPPYLNGTLVNAFKQVVPLISQSAYEMEIVVWATTPSKTAWARATKQATGLRSEFVTKAGLSDEARSRTAAVGRPWLFSDVKRPVLSIVVRRR